MASGSFRRRRLGRELRKLRDERGLRIERVAPNADISAPTLSRIENAAVDIKVNTVKALLDVYGIDGEERDALITLAREARQQSWWHAYGDVLPDWFEVYVDLEGEADTLDVYDSILINGLLQTDDYARALILSSRPDDPPEEIERRVELRMQRQSRITSGTLRLRTVVDECALHRFYGNDSVMRAQIRRLIDVANLPNVSLHLLPSGSPPSTAGGFTILSFGPAHPPVVYLESHAGALYLEKPEQFQSYSRLYDRLRASSLSPDASVARLAQLLKE